jgi:hypothetical protein
MQKELQQVLVVPEQDTQVPIALKHALVNPEADVSVSPILKHLLVTPEREGNEDGKSRIGRRS